MERDFDEYEGIDYEEDYFGDSDDFDFEEDIIDADEYTDSYDDEPEEEITPNVEPDDYEDSDADVEYNDEDFYFDEDDDEDFDKSNDVISYEEQMDIFANEIFTTICSEDKKSPTWKEKFNVFKAKLDSRVFKNENYMIAKLINVSPTVINLPRNIMKVMLVDKVQNIADDSGKYIDIENYKDLDGAKEYGFINSVLDTIEEYKKGQPQTTEDFITSIEAYKALYQQVEIVRTMQKGIEIATTGSGSGRNRKIGLDASMVYVKKNFADVSGLLEEQEGKGFIDMKDTMEPTERTKRTLICDFGDIPSLNKAYGGLYTGNFYQIMGPPKGGKSKKCAELCYNAIMNKANVTVWPVEGGINMWTAQMRAIHCHRYTNKDKTASTVITNLPTQREILDGTMETVIQDMETISCNDLKTNMGSKYGNVAYIDRPFLLETFIEEIKTSVESNNSQLVIIDYMQLIDTENARLAEHEMLRQAYKKLLNYCKKHNVAVLTPVQYKQEVVSALASGSDNASVDMRVSAGGSAEVIRTPDMTIPMWASAQELEQGIMYIQPMPNRLGPVIKTIKMHVDLGYCIFAEADDD